MFVSKLTYNLVAAERDLLRAQVRQLEQEITTLRLQAISGIKSHRRQFNDDDLKRLLQLCHPDKHGGKQSSIDMTQKINQLRNQLRKQS